MVINKNTKKQRVVFSINKLEEEREIIDNTNKKMKWFKKNGYDFTLPDKPLISVYNNKDYQKKTKEIRDKWEKQESKFFFVLESFFGKKFKKKIIVHISKYGVGGGYNLPNNVYINIDLRYDPIETIKHEIIHLIIENFIEKNKIKHWEKEKIVELLEGILDIYSNKTYVSR